MAGERSVRECGEPGGDVCGVAVGVGGAQGGEIGVEGAETGASSECGVVSDEVG